jgi:hypothetical protein
VTRFAPAQTPTEAAGRRTTRLLRRKSCGVSSRGFLSASARVESASFYGRSSLFLITRAPHPRNRLVLHWRYVRLSRSSSPSSESWSSRRASTRQACPYRVNFAGSPIFGQKAALRDPKNLVRARSGRVNRAQTVPAPGTANARPATVFFSLMGAEGTPTDRPRPGPDDRRRSLLIATSIAAAVKSRPKPRGPCVRRPRPAATSHPEEPPAPREAVDATRVRSRGWCSTVGCMGRCPDPRVYVESAPVRHV